MTIPKDAKLFRESFKQKTLKCISWLHLSIDFIFLKKRKEEGKKERKKEKVNYYCYLNI